MRHLLILLLLVGCCSKPIVQCSHPRPKPPEDLTGEMLNRKDIPDKFIKNYVEWVRYDYDIR